MSFNVVLLILEISIKPTLAHHMYICIISMQVAYQCIVHQHLVLCVMKANNASMCLKKCRNMVVTTLALIQGEFARLLVLAQNCNLRHSKLYRCLTHTYLYMCTCHMCILISIWKHLLAKKHNILF